MACSIMIFSLNGCNFDECIVSVTLCLSSVRDQENKWNRGSSVVSAEHTEGRENQRQWGAEEVERCP